jgi:hypothetical protein
MHVSHAEICSVLFLTHWIEMTRFQFRLLHCPVLLPPSLLLLQLSMSFCEIPISILLSFLFPATTPCNLHLHLNSKYVQPVCSQKMFVHFSPCNPVTLCHMHTLFFYMLIAPHNLCCSTFMLVALAHHCHPLLLLVGVIGPQGMPACTYNPLQ